MQVIDTAVFAEMRAAFQSSRSQFEQVRQSKAPLSDRWVQMLGIVLPIQVEVISRFGFPRGQEGLTQFNHATNNLGEKEALWKELLEMSFGVREVESVSEERALEILEAVSVAIEDEGFLSAVEEATRGVEGTFEKRQAVIGLLLPLQMTALEPFGFVGEEGFIRFQYVLAMYMHLPAVTKRSEEVTRKLFRRAGLA